MFCVGSENIGSANRFVNKRHAIKRKINQIFFIKNTPYIILIIVPLIFNKIHAAFYSYAYYYLFCYYVESNCLKENDMLERIDLWQWI